MKARTLTLPSGRRVTLRPGSATAADKSDEREAPEGLFGAARAALAGGTVTVVDADDGATLHPDDLALGDFHVLRGVLTKDGALEEPAVEITCRNCDAPLEVRPCASLEIAPWEDGELGDPELDATLPFGEPIEIPTIPLGRVRSASTVTFAPLTVRQAAPLFVAFEKGVPAITPAIVAAMGITALGNEEDPKKIAEALSACDDDAFDAVTDAFLASHYVLRLGGAVACRECGARNDVDAPYDREIAAVGPRPTAPPGDDVPAGDFPDLAAFVERANDIAEPLLRATPEGGDIELVVDDGVPAVDDGGEPLLGSYVPPSRDGFGAHVAPPTVTLYFRTFRGVWDDEGPYDWEEELRETIEHELEHHVYFLQGRDPMDEAEHAEIDEEARRLVGTKESNRRAIKGFGESVKSFVVKAWPIFVILLLALAITLASQQD